ncbi:MAG: twin-arginine translocase subunit TatC [Microbacterium sp.]|uniref:twin-arginine translocase subunit TatC n=1 Tax=Microbacterium sp. TaxID=51671 RepID=UPI0039E224DD
MRPRSRADGVRRGTMTFGGHLAELRRRLMVSAAAVLLGAVAGWLLTDAVWALLSDPVAGAGQAGGRAAAINFGSVTAAFDLRIRLALQLGILLSAPIWLYQVFAFIVPGLTRRESRVTVAFLGSAVPLFALGCAAGLYVLPHVVLLMTAFAPEQSATLLDAATYYDFVLKLVLVVGVSFVLPVFLVLLNAIGVISGRTILRSWRYALLAICLFTAVATPAADVLTMFVLAAPMVVLYFAAVGVAMIHDRRATRALAGAPPSHPTTKEITP